MIFYKKKIPKAMIPSPDCDKISLGIVAGVFQRKALVYILLILQKLTNASYADDLTPLANTPAQAESLRHSL